MDWNTAVEAAERFIPFLQENTPDFVEEMKGIVERWHFCDIPD